MPTIAATITKAVLRRLIASRNGGFSSYATTGAGSTTTLVIGALAGLGADSIVGKWFLLTAVGRWRRAVAFDTSNGTVTVTHAYESGTGSGVTVEIFPLSVRPDLIGRAFNDAAPELYQMGVYRLVNSHLIANAERTRDSGNSWYGVPRNMRKVSKVTYLGPRRHRDHFDRADSTAEPGNSWVETTGTSGISSERFYFIGDTDSDKAHRQEKMRDGVIQANVRGTLAHNTTYRTPAIIFRQNEDYANALDASNYLVVRLRSADTGASGGVVDLRKVDGGTESSLTTGAVTTSNDTWYELRVSFIGPRIQVWVDDVQLIDYALTGLNLKYTQYQRFGLRLDKGGSPATDAFVDNFYAFEVDGSAYEWRDWDAPRDSTTIELPAFGREAPTGLLWVEGQGQLSLLGEDSTTQLLDTDSTAVIEIALTDPAMARLLYKVEEKLYLLQSKNVDSETGQLTPSSAAYEALAAKAELNARKAPGMPSASAGGRLRGVQV